MVRTNRTLVYDAQQKEYRRLSFVSNRGTKEETLQFARQTYRIYRKVIFDKTNVYGRVYHSQLLGSLIVLRGYLQGREKHAFKKRA